MSEKHESIRPDDREPVDEKTRHIESIRDERKAQFRAAFPELAPQVHDAGERLERVLMHYLSRPGGDPEVMTLLEQLIGKLDHAVSYGSSSESLSPERLKDVKAVLAAATMTLDIQRDRFKKTRVESFENAMPDAVRFMRLWDKRVGRPDADGSAEVCVVDVKN